MQNKVSKTIVTNKRLERLKWYIHYFIEHEMLQSEGATIIHECPNCHTRYPLNNLKPMAVQRLEDFMIEFVETSEIERAILWNMIAERTALARWEDSEEYDLPKSKDSHAE